MHKPSNAQTKANKQQCLLLWQALQEIPSNGVIASKDGKRYLRSKGSV